MSEEKTRVDFNAPASLVERADIVADLLDTSRTRLLVDALRDELDDRIEDEQLQRRLRDAYYDGRVDFSTVESVLGTEEAMRLQLLRESLDRDPPRPHIEGEIPSGETFYDGPVPEWTPEDADDEEPSA